MRIRLIAGAIALACFGTTFKIMSLGSHLRLTAIIPVLLGFAVLALACGPDSWINRLTVAILRRRQIIVTAEWNPPQAVVTALAIFGTALGLWGVWSAWQVPTNLEETDQGAYLAAARQIRTDGGVLTLVRQLYSGEFREANRHPFYLGLLSLDPTATWGKCLSTIAVLVAVVGTVAVLSRRSGLLASTFFLIWCSINPALLKSATMVGCEAWLMVWVSLTWWILDRRHTSGAASESEPRQGLLRTFFAGLSLGLGWITKGTALPLLPLTTGWFWFAPRRSTAARRFVVPLAAICVLVCGWIVTAQPLLIRNMRAFQSPFHNVNSWLLFVDSFEDPVELSQNRRLGELAREYIHTHSIGELIGREANGLVWESFIVLRLLGVGPSNLSRAVSGMMIALLALLGASVCGRWAMPLVVLWTIALVPLFAWYIPIAADDRFLVPLAPIWIAYAAEGAAALVIAGFGTRSAQAVNAKCGAL